MRKARFKEAQIVKTIEEHEAGREAKTSVDIWVSGQRHSTVAVDVNIKFYLRS